MNRKRPGQIRRRIPSAHRATPVLDDVRTNSNECVLDNDESESCPKTTLQETGSTEPNSLLTKIITAWPLLQPHVRETILTLVEAVAPMEPIEAHDNPKRNQCPNLKSVLNDLDAHKADSLRRTILKALRHKPEDFGLRMDCDGWVDIREVGAFILRFTDHDQCVEVDELISAIGCLGFGDRIEVLADCMRATYGHSTNRFNPTRISIPDLPLFHGTSSDLWPFINSFGLVSGDRRFVQLTTDFDYAQRIALAHKSSPIVIQVRTTQASEMGIQFYPTSTHAWLATNIPSDYLQLWLVAPPTLDEDWLDDHPNF